jgi:DNA-binding IclR family transcriptional regulator
VPAPAKRLTAHQKDFVALVARLAVKLGRAPSATDVAQETGTTRLGARRMLKACEAHGLLRDKPRVISSGEWELTAIGRSLLEEE